MARPLKHLSQIGEKSRKKNAARYKDRENEPKLGNFLKSAPEHLTEHQKGLWTELVGRVSPGVLMDCDRFIVELTVRLTERMRAGSLSATETGQYRGCLASLGITPADRSRVKAPPAPPVKSLLDRILNGENIEPVEDEDPTVN